MTTTDFSASLLVDKSSEEAFDAIANVNEWWTQSFIGSAKNCGDVFSVTFGETFVDFKITEAIPGKKAVWLVTGCNLNWLADKKEWKDTQIVWDIKPAGDATEIVMTHVGLVPEIECFENCKKGWDFFVRESLFKFLKDKRGLPDRKERSAEPVQ